MDSAKHNTTNTPIILNRRCRRAKQLKSTDGEKVYACIFKYFSENLSFTLAEIKNSNNFSENISDVKHLKYGNEIFLIKHESRL